MADIIPSNNWNLYDPNWEVEFDKHHNAYKALLEKEERTQEDEAQMAIHDRGWKDAHTSQFKNGSEYADFMLKFSKNKAQSRNLVWVEIDTKNIKTVEQANELFNQTNEFLDDQVKDRSGALPVSKDKNLFSADNTISSHARFTGFRNQSVTSTIVTMQDDGNGLNICFTALKENTGTSVINNIEGIANQLYHMNLKERHAYSPEQIKWYTHVPAHIHGRESFCHVPMVFMNDEFDRPDFDHQDSVPDMIKKARFNAAQNDMGLVRKQGTPETSQPDFFNQVKKILGFKNTP